MKCYNDEVLNALFQVFGTPDYESEENVEKRLSNICNAIEEISAKYGIDTIILNNLIKFIIAEYIFSLNEDNREMDSAGLTYYRDLIVSLAEDMEAEVVFLYGRVCHGKLAKKPYVVHIGVVSQEVLEEVRRRIHSELEGGIDKEPGLPK